MAMWRDWRQRLWGWLGAGKEAPMGVAAAADLDAQVLRMQKVGAGNVQVGQVGGDMQVLHQHFYPPPCPQASDCSVRPGAAPAANDGARLSPEQREVYALMRQLPRHDYLRVLAFMREQFGTGLVQQLHGQALRRLRGYVVAVQRNRVGVGVGV